MNGMQSKALCVATVLTLGSAGVPGVVQAATLSIGSMTVTGGSWHDSNAGVPPASFDYIGPNTNLVGGYIGSGGTALDNIGAAHQVGGYDLDFYFYTAATNLGDPYDNYPAAGSLAGGPIPSGTVDDVAGTISVDMSSFFLYLTTSPGPTQFYTTDADQGGIATGSWNPATYAYSMSWTATAAGTLLDSTLAPLTGYQATYVLAGVANPVPVPATVWLFGSGLMGLAAIVRRKKEQA